MKKSYQALGFLSFMILGVLGAGSPDRVWAQSCTPTGVSAADAASSVMIAIIQIHPPAGEREIIVGSGVVLAGTRQIVTAAHVADETRQDGMIAEIFSNEGKFIGFASLASQRGASIGPEYQGSIASDYALLQVMPISGDEAIRNFNSIQGVQVSKHPMPPISVLKGEGYSIGGGMSGGGVFDSDGALAGIVVADGDALPGLPALRGASAAIQTTAFSVSEHPAAPATIEGATATAEPEYIIATGVGGLPGGHGDDYAVAGYPDLKCSGGPAHFVQTWHGTMTETPDGGVAVGEAP